MAEISSVAARFREDCPQLWDPRCESWKGAVPRQEERVAASLKRLREYSGIEGWCLWPHSYPSPPSFNWRGKFQTWVWLWLWMGAWLFHGCFISREPCETKVILCHCCFRRAMPNSWRQWVGWSVVATSQTLLELYAYSLYISYYMYLDVFFQYA